MNSRARAAGFGVAAILCAVASAGVAAGYSQSVEQQLGELRPVVVAAESLDEGLEIDRKTLRRRLETREVPVRFAPPDAILEPEAALGRETAIAIPAGSYLTVSQFKAVVAERGSPSRLDAVPGLQPIDVGVTSAAALAPLAASPGGLLVDIVAASRPDGVNPRVEVVAESVRLIALVEREPDAISGDSADWTATVVVDRGTALRLIEAENFAAEIRLIPRR